MIRLPGNRVLRISITVFTAFAVLASFCFADTDLLRAADLAAGGTGNAAGLADSFIPSPAEEPALLTKIGNTQFTPLRTGFQRIFLPCGTHEAASAFCQPPFRTITNISYIIDVKHTIHLKLRI